MAELGQHEPSRTDEYGTEVQAAVDAYERHELAESRKHFARAHALQPSARTLRGLGVTAFGLGMYAQAVDEFTAALSDQRRPLTAELRAEAESMLKQASARVSAHSPAPRLKEPTRPQPAAAEPEPELAVPTRTAPERSSSFRVQTGLALASGVVGVAGVVVGSVFGLRSISQGSLRDRYCIGNICDNERGYRAGREAITAGNVSTIAFIVGAAGLAGGVVLWLTEDSPREHASARVRVGLASVALEAAWQ